MPRPAIAAESILVAVASNFMQPFKELASAFDAQTGITVEVTYASSGVLYNQIIEGASYDLFLSADEDRPTFLFQAEVAEKPFIYARGRVILWSSRKDFCRADDWKQALSGGDVKRIAMASPATSPYGVAAIAVLEQSSLRKALQNHMVYAQDVAQAFQYASMGAADVCFCAVSCLATVQGRSGCFYEMDKAADVIQSACVLRRSKKREFAQRFAVFLLSPEADEIKKRYGYR